jgi:hypothetical protein
MPSVSIGNGTGARIFGRHYWTLLDDHQRCGRAMFNRNGWRKVFGIHKRRIVPEYGKDMSTTFGKDVSSCPSALYRKRSRL